MTTDDTSGKITQVTPAAADDPGSPPRGSRSADGEERSDGLEIGGLVRRTRRTADLSQRDLATKVGVSPALIGAIERDRVTPSLTAFQKILKTAGYRLVVCDAERHLVAPLEVWQDVADAAGRRYPAHLDTILDPVFGQWWGDVYGLQAPPETFRRSRAWREWQRSRSQWEVRVSKFRFAPPPRQPPLRQEWDA